MTTTTTTEDHGDGVAQRIEHAGERVAEIKHEVGRRLGSRIEALGAVIQRHPFAAAGIGMGIGYLIARLVHR